jgi:hypothetical protein
VQHPVLAREDWAEALNGHGASVAVADDLRSALTTVDQHDDCLVICDAASDTQALTLGLHGRGMNGKILAPYTANDVVDALDRLIALYFA